MATPTTTIRTTPTKLFVSVELGALPGIHHAASARCSENWSRNAWCGEFVVTPLALRWVQSAFLKTLQSLSTSSLSKVARNVVTGFPSINDSQNIKNITLNQPNDAICPFNSLAIFMKDVGCEIFNARSC
jgi:hypothetical protein